MTLRPVCPPHPFPQGVAADLEASRARLLLAAEGDWPFRRELHEHEAAAGLDAPALDHVMHLALERLLAAWQPLRQLHVDELLSQIHVATEHHPPGDATWVGTLALPALDSARLLAAVSLALDDGRATAIDEAHRQAPGLAEAAERAERPDHAKRLQAYADGAERLLAGGMLQSASSEAFRLTATSEDIDVAAHVETILGETPLLAERDILAGMATGAVNEGRYEVMDFLLGQRSSALEAAEETATIYALEILDKNTCDECAAIDGQEYFSMDAARVDYPGIGGGYVRCKGRTRCRGSLVIVYGTEAPPTQIEPATPGPLPKLGPKPKLPAAPEPPAPPAPPAAPAKFGLLADGSMSLDLLQLVQEVSQLAPAGASGDQVLTALSMLTKQTSEIMQATGLSAEQVAAIKAATLTIAEQLAARFPIGSRWLYNNGPTVRVVGYDDQGRIQIAIEGETLHAPGGFHFVTDPERLAPVPLPVAPAAPIVAKPVEGLPGLQDVAQTMQIDDAARRSTTDEQRAIVEAMREQVRVEAGKLSQQQLAARTGYGAQYLALLDYGGSGYSEMNGVLRGSLPDDFAGGRTKLAVENLQAFFSEGNAPLLGTETIVYRGMSIALGDPLVGRVIQDEAFMSTSIQHRIGESFASGLARTGREKIILHLHLRPGIPVAPGLTHLHEGELILPPGTRYVVVQERATIKTSVGAQPTRQFDAIVLLPGEGLP